jgi:hypothetical protein
LNFVFVCAPWSRLWAEVFHVSASGAGTVKWQQVSEDLVPVNITCIQDSPECVFHITAYNSQVDKILDVRLIQPGTKFQLEIYNLMWFPQSFLLWEFGVFSFYKDVSITSPTKLKYSSQKLQREERK